MCFQLQLLNTSPRGRAVSATVVEGPAVMVLGCADPRPAAELLGRRCLHPRASQTMLDICKVMIVLQLMWDVLNREPKSFIFIFPGLRNSENNCGVSNHKGLNGIY